MKAARRADTCTLRGVILKLAREHVARLGCNLDLGLRKDQRGINDEGTACLVLPYVHIEDYLSNPEERVHLQLFQRTRSSLFYYSFRARVDQGELVIGADEWPIFLYDETKYDPKREWTGLFLGETFVHVSPPH